ncbi:hypothetical protein QYE76_019121 [Lolium multiflorum]|uniref:CCHC-type domain-containing protein n=1 Tax=Lolium multiflorum TaxID=4521 RepID=A0AAD8R5W2_LOLMU|nr:hypothetical protein QYE76_019121 [Lolium multiflorum]
MASPINFNQFLEKEKLKSNGSNFTDWFRHVRIFLSGGNLQFVLDAPLGDPPAEDESDEVKAVYATRKTRYSQVQCAILCSLESDLQKRFEHHDPHELMNELKAIFETHAAVECYEASKHFFSCMMEEGSSVSEHMLAMTGHAKKLSDLGIVIPNRLGINRVLQSLPPSYKNFVMNYNMQNMNKELPELFGMLKAAEIEIKKEHQVLMVNKTTSFKKQGKSKGKFKKGGKKAATPPMKPKNGPKPDAECYYCKEKGHWKRNCSKYLADLKSGLVKKKKEGNNSKEKHAYEVTTRGGVSTQDPLYPEGHPKRIEQDSQRIEPSAHSRKKKKKKHKNVVESSEPVNDPNSISISDAETESGNEHDNDKDNDKNDTPDKEEVEEEPEKHAKNKKEAMKKFNFGELFKKGTTSTGRPSRAATRIRRSYNEDIIAPSFAPEEDNGPPNASTFPCYDFLRNAGILEDFLTLVNRAGLTTYMGDEREQYYLLTKIFVESFQFNNKQYEPTVAFRIYGNPVTMQLKDFCRALDIAPIGTASRIDDNPRDLLELYRGITDDDCRTIQRGKIRNIQLPAIKYFAYYIATSILGRENTSNISSYHLAFLNIALTGQTSYHLGALIARRLTTRGPIFGGTIALRVLTYLNLPIDPNDVPLAPRKLDIVAMKSHHFVTTDSTLDNMVYRMLFSDGDEKEIPLPQLGLLSIDRQSWSCTKEEVDEHLKIKDFHQQHDPEDAGPPTTTPSHIRVLLLAHTRNTIHLRHTTETLLHGIDGIELHLGQKPKLGGGPECHDLRSEHVIVSS